MLEADFYDCQDCLRSRDVPGVPSTGETIDFALEIALELSDQKITAEQAAEEICRRAAAWKAWKAGEPERREATREKQETTQAALGAANDKIFWWRVYCAASSFLAAVIFFLAISMR